MVAVDDEAVVGQVAQIGSELGDLLVGGGLLLQSDVAAVIPSATMATTVATGMRRPRTVGVPPITSGSVVIRSKATPGAYRRSSASGGR